MLFNSGAGQRCYSYLDEQKKSKESSTKEKERYLQMLPMTSRKKQSIKNSCWKLTAIFT